MKLPAPFYAGFKLHVRRGMGARVGERRFPGRPQPVGTELESHAAYAPGDDLRHLDWHALARLDALVMRRFVAEREVCFGLLVDTSASMGLPVRDDKLGVARELATALAFVALGAGDAVRVVCLGADPRPSPVFRRRAATVQVAGWLAAHAAAGALDLGTALVAHAARRRMPGATVVISDFLCNLPALEDGVLALRARGDEIVLLHVLGAGDADPGREVTRGVLRDAETGARHPVVLNAAARARYAELLAAHLEALEGLAARAGALYARLTTGMPVERFVTADLGRLGLVRRR